MMLLVECITTRRGWSKTLQGTKQHISRFCPCKEKAPRIQRAIHVYSAADQYTGCTSVFMEGDVMI